MAYVERLRLSKAAINFELNARNLWNADIVKTLYRIVDLLNCLQSNIYAK